MDQQALNNLALRDPFSRRGLAHQSHLFFFHLYFSEYAKYQTADFQKEMIQITEDDKLKFAVILAFRGSAKSTIMTQSLPIWAVVGAPQKKFILIISQTQQQARLHLANIKRMIEGNEMLRRDFGINLKDSPEWGSNSIVIPKYNARILCASSEQSIRGIRHDSYRPDLIICDDVEDINSVKTQDGRDHTYTWFTSEVIPCGDHNTKIVVVGNLLHRDSLLMRLKEEIKSEKREGIIKSYPIRSKKRGNLWPGKYPDVESVKKERAKVGDKFSWFREYLLKIIDDQEAVVQPKWIHYYEDLPDEEAPDLPFSHYAMGVDPAFSLSEKADYTAMVTVKIFGYGYDRKCYILPNPVNKRLNYQDSLDQVRLLVDTNGEMQLTQIYIEEVAAQTLFIQEFEKRGYRVEGFKPGGMDKRARLISVAQMIHSGKILFPKEGADLLIKQILGFGVEKHDDLADALTTVMIKLRSVESIPQDFDDEEVEDLIPPRELHWAEKLFGPYSH